MEKIIEQFLEMVKLGGASRDERAVADYMTEKLKELGCSVYEDDAGERAGGNTGNLIARLPGPLPGCVALSAHMDRVSNGYNIKPSFTDDGWIVSDGTTILGADNVSGLASILDGLRRLKNSGAAHSEVEVVLSICEEDGILGARLLDPSLMKADMCFVFDSTGPLGQIDVKRPYKAMIDMEVVGKRAHGGSPEKGVNAIKAACNMLAGIREGRLDEESTSNLGVFHGGPKEPGTVCGSVKIRCEARSVDRQKLIGYLKYFEEYCREHIKGSGARLEFSYEIQHGNCCYTEDDEIVKLAMGELRAMGIEPTLGLTMEGCDGNVYNSNGVPCISFGMGNANAHSLDEKVKVDELIRSGELAERLILAYSRRQEGKK